MYLMEPFSVLGKVAEFASLALCLLCAGMLLDVPVALLNLLRSAFLGLALQLLRLLAAVLFSTHGQSPFPLALAPGLPLDLGLGSSLGFTLGFLLGLAGDFTLGLVPGRALVFRLMATAPPRDSSPASRRPSVRAFHRRRAAGFTR